MSKARKQPKKMIVDAIGEATDEDAYATDGDVDYEDEKTNRKTTKNTNSTGESEEDKELKSGPNRKTRNESKRAPTIPKKKKSAT